MQLAPFLEYLKDRASDSLRAIEWYRGESAELIYLRNDLDVADVKLRADEGVEIAAQIATCVEDLLNGDAELGGDTDWSIEQHLRALYGLTGDDMVHISNQMGLVAYHQTMQELYPDGKPRTPERKNEISLNVTAAEADD